MARLMSRFCEDLSPPKQIDHVCAPREINTVTGTDVNAHFGDAFTHRLTVTEITVLGRPDTVDDPGATCSVFQFSEPGIKLIGALKDVHVPQCIRSDTDVQIIISRKQREGK